MTEEKVDLLTPEKAAEVDAQYVAFPSFQEWLWEPPRVELWQASCDQLNALSDSATSEDLVRAREIVMRAAAFDTGAIEGLYSTDRGLTLTVATQAAAWEQEVNERGEDTRALFEAQLSAFELILDHVTNRFPRVTQAWIRRLHEEITGPQEVYVVQTPVGAQQQPVPKGKYKIHPNHVRTETGSIHAYAPVELTASEMARLVDELGTAEFRDAHPLIQASYAHYALVAVHPFADGNGRVARALASAYTYRAASVPLLVLAHHREQYFAALASADSGDPAPFIDFVSRVARDGIELVAETLRAAQAPQPEDLLTEFKDLYMAQGELSHHQLDQLASDFTDELFSIVSEQVEALSVPDGVSLHPIAGSGGNHGNPPAGFRKLVHPSGRYVSVNLESAPPANATAKLHFDVFVSTDSDTAATVLVQSSIEKNLLVLGLADLRPALSSTARLRVQNFSRRLLGSGLDILLRRAKEKLQGRGY